MYHIDANQLKKPRVFPFLSTPVDSASQYEDKISLQRYGCKVQNTLEQNKRNYTMISSNISTIILRFYLRC